MSKSIRNYFGDYFSSKNGIILLCLFLIAPFLLLSYFNQPAGDDYWYNVSTRDLGYWKTQSYYFNEINSRYIATAISSLTLWLSYNLVYYKLLPVVLIAMLIYVLYYLASIVFPNNSKKNNFLFSLFCFITFLINTPNLSSNFYWLSGAITYQLSNIIFILFLCSIITLIRNNKAKSLFISIFFVIVIGGLNEITLLMTDILLLFVIGYQLIDLKKVDFKILILVFLAISLTLISLNSGGNSIRQENNVNNHQLFFSIKNTLNDLRLYITKWLPNIIILMLIFLSFIKNNKRFSSHKIFKINAYAAIGGFVIILFVGFFIGNWALGKSLPVRAVNNLCLYFTLGFIYLSIIFLHKYIIIEKDFIIYSKPLQYALCLIFFFQLIHSSNIKTAYSDLLSGRAHNYNIALNNRKEIIFSNNKDTIYVEKLKKLPSTIYAGDITDNPKDWRNQCYDSYFNKTIIIK